jgi:predicted DCC family thiol-disulfide oxidoreductase YuxK
MSCSVSREGSYVLLYDAGCPLCRLFRRLFGLLAGDALSAVPLADSRAARLLPALSPEARWASFHLVGPDGVIRSGEEAMPRLLRLAGPLGGLGRMAEEDARLAAWLARLYGALVFLRAALAR